MAAQKKLEAGSKYAGFDKDGVFTVSKFISTTATCSPGADITTYGKFTSDDPSLGIVCGNTNYPSTMPQSSLGSGWQYVGAINSPDNNSMYIYALVNKDTNSIDQVVACCDCKAVYIKTHNSMNYCGTNATTQISIDIAGFVSGVENPKWSLVSQPQYGSAYLNPTLSTSEKVVWTYQNTATDDWTADSFTIEVQNNCGTSNQLIVPIGRAREIVKTDTDISVFVDSCTMTQTDADRIKATFESLKVAIKNVCSNWTGTINYIPVDSKGDSGNYINHAKAMIDMKSGATGSIAVATGSWSSWKSLPAHWDASYIGSVPTSTYIFSFVSSASGSCGSYGETTLSAGFGAQPSVSYQQNYDELLDIVNGTTTTSWGGQMNSTQPGWGIPVFGSASNKSAYFTQVLMPIISDTGSTSAAAVLQMAGAILGKLALKPEFHGIKTGNVQYPLNLQNYLQDGVASMAVPYNITTPVGNSMTGLQDYGYLQSLWLENGVDLSASNTDLKTVLLSILGVDENITSYNCSVITDVAQLMKDGSGRSTYSYNNSSCAHASAAALASTNPMSIYNKTGVLWDTSTGNKLAFKTLQGCAEQNTADEIETGWYGVVNGQNNYNIAYYTKGGAGWSSPQCMDGAGGCKAC